MFCRIGIKDDSKPTSQSDCSGFLLRHLFRCGNLIRDETLDGNTYFCFLLNCVKYGVSCGPCLKNTEAEFMPGVHFKMNVKNIYINNVLTTF